MPIEGEDRRHAMSELVLEIATAAAGELDLDRILQAALDRLGRVVALTGGSIALVDRDELVIRAAKPGRSSGRRLGSVCRAGAGAGGRCSSTLEPEPHRRLPEPRPWQPAGAEAKLLMRSWLAVPISRRGEGIGSARSRLDRAVGLCCRGRPSCSRRSRRRWPGRLTSPRATPPSSAPACSAMRSPAWSATSCARPSRPSSG